MKKYVELDAIIDRLDDEWGFLGMREELYNLPTADVAEIVRCKDCALRKTEDCAMYFECDCGEQCSWETDNDYCSLGKKEKQE